MSEAPSSTRVMEALETFMAASSVRRSLDAIRRYAVAPEKIDDVILAAINAGLCLVSHGDNHVAEGFNDDLARNGRSFGRRFVAA
jgi:hypothetical protein